MKSRKVCLLFCFTAVLLGITLGATHAPALTEIYVDWSNLTHLPDGSMENPYPTIGEAVTSLWFTCDPTETYEIRVAGGTYPEWVDTVVLPDQPRLDLVGGYNSQEGWTHEPQDNETVIQGEPYGATVVGMTDMVSLSYFTIRGGFTGVWAVGTDISINDCQITEMEYEGIRIEPGNAIISDCRVTDNEGGGIFISGQMGVSTAQIINCEIVNNNNPVGGGIKVDGYCAASVHDCTIRGNQADMGGGVWAGLNSEATLFNCLVVENTAGVSGGGIASDSDAVLEVLNCTVADNEAERGGGIRVLSNTITITNSIVWDNVADYFPEIYTSGFEIATSYSDIGDENFSGPGVIHEDPGLVVSLNGNYYLSPMVGGEGNPCLDAGDADADSLDLEGLTVRTDQVPDQGVVDLGAHYDFLLKGDVDMDGSITEADAHLAFFIAMGTTEADAVQVWAADWNDDGIVSAGDAQAIYYAALGMEAPGKSQSGNTGRNRHSNKAKKKI